MRKGGEAAKAGEGRREERQSTLPLPPIHSYTLIHLMSGRAECNCVEQNGKPFNTEGNRSRERHIGPVWDFYSYAHITLFLPSNTATRKLA